MLYALACSCLFATNPSVNSTHGSLLWIMNIVFGIVVMVIMMVVNWIYNVLYIVLLRLSCFEDIAHLI